VHFKDHVYILKSIFCILRSLKFHLQVEVMLFLLGALGVGLSDEALNAALQVP
jgi:hypothetical protein